MFQTYEFIYNDVPSSMYGLFICDFDGTNNNNVSFGNKADIIERKVNNRVSPLHFGVDYNKDPLSFDLVFASNKELDRWDMQEIAMWLTGHDNYKWLQIEQPDMMDLHYRCLITELTPLHVGWAPYAFQATIRCDCPYAYGPERTFSNRSGYGMQRFSILNMGSARVPSKPFIKVDVDQSGVLSIENTSGDNKKLKLEIKYPRSVTSISIDNKNNIIVANDPSLDVYEGFNDVFLKLFPGINNLVINGATSIDMSWREYYNAGA